MWLNVNLILRISVLYMWSILSAWSRDYNRVQEMWSRVFPVVKTLELFAAVTNIIRNLTLLGI